jgi:hypothetical protein
MLKIILQNRDGTTTWIFGLSEGNVQNLKKGRPMLFDLSDMGLPSQKVSICYGPTEEILETQLTLALGRKVKNAPDRG